MHCPITKTRILFLLKLYNKVDFLSEGTDDLALSQRVISKVKGFNEGH